MIKKPLLLVAFLLISVCSLAQEVEEEKFRITWDNGFKVKSASNDFSLKFGGRIMYDMGFFDMDEEGISNGYELYSKQGNEFRRARFFTSGTLYKNIDFKLQVDFAGGNVNIKDAYINIKNLPLVGNFRAGHFVDPIVLDAFTSSKYISFMERSIITGLVSGRNSGVMIFDQFSKDRWSWQLGVFTGKLRQTSDNPIANGDFAITSRLAHTLLDKNRHTIHIGASHSFRKPQTKKEFGFSLRPGAHISSKYLTALVEDVNHVNAFNFETSFVLNSIAIQSEYLHVTAKNNLKNEKFDSFYVQTSYFLTGERRAYKNALNGFGRVIPKSNFGDGGTGAFEFALRFSSATGLNNDRMNVFTAGLNWHLNSATRIMLNQIISNIDNTTQYTGKGTFKAFQMRFQIDF